MNKPTPEQLERFFILLKVGINAVEKAKEQNRKLGIPNWYSIDGVIVSDQELAAFKKAQRS